MKTIEINWQKVAKSWAWNMTHKGETLTEDEQKIVDALKDFPLPKLMHLCEILQREVEYQLLDEIDKKKEAERLEGLYYSVNDLGPTELPEVDSTLDNCMEIIRKREEELHDEVYEVREDLVHQGYPMGVYNLLF